VLDRVREQDEEKEMENRQEERQWKSEDTRTATEAQDGTITLLVLVGVAEGFTLEILAPQTRRPVRASQSRNDIQSGERDKAETEGVTVL
jgi:hypothetical protein